MLKISIPDTEVWDEQKQEFINVKATTLTLEHSLVSISKWESKWCKHFLNNQDKKPEEIIDYFRCMTLTQNVDPNVYYALTDDNYREIASYMDNPMTATWFKKEDKPVKREVITSEVIYYYMVALQIPFSCEKWHFNRLMTLINVCNEKNKSPKKMNQRQIMSRNQALNAARRAKLKTMG